MIDFHDFLVQKFGQPHPFIRLDRAAFQKTEQEFKRAFILYALQRTDWNKSKAAKLLGYNRNTIRNWIKKYSLD
jgi:DNA-binding NtrC family response regulator